MALDITLVIGGFVSTYIFLRVLLFLTQDAREPPIVAASVPFLGPLFGLVWGKAQYYVTLRNKFHFPVYTLRLPFSRIYVISSPELITPVQKQWQALSFSPFSAGAGKVLGMSKQSLEVMHQGLTDRDGYSASWVRRMTSVLGPGEDLDAISRRSIELFLDDLKTLATNGKTTTGFWEWIRRSIIKATSESIYGPQNPLRDPRVEDAWRVFEAKFLNLAISPLPSVLSRTAFQAREICAAAMIEYMKKGGFEKGSKLVKIRHDVHKHEHGFPLEDIGRGELGNTFAILGNTTPTAWWFLYHVFSDSRVLSDIRDELEAFVQIDVKTNTHCIDLACIRTSCPILFSTFQEMLRFRAVNAGPRMVMEDVVVNGFLFKKGNVLMIPASVHHTDVPTWGESAMTFDHMRFARKFAPGKKGHSRVAFRAFGGGHVLCPGRHFASIEIMALGALLALQYDVKPVCGQWTEPKCNNSPIAAGLPIPDHDIPVEFQARHPGRQWSVTFSGSSEAMGIVSEDVLNST
ncbi:cytochrome P450 [Nemania sp. FL0031]|nr:cytochrome P450 [Nemania sp. FL0031]